MSKAPIEIRSLARLHTEEAIKTLAEIMRDKDVNASARVNASEALLDRGWGKAPQHITHERIDNLSDEQIQGELESILAVLRGFGLAASGAGTGERVAIKTNGAKGPGKPH